jgi:YVTN family beta-propeller protein
MPKFFAHNFPPPIMNWAKHTDLTSLALFLFVVLHLGLGTDVIAAPFAYVGHLSNSGQAGLVSVIDTASNINVGTIPVGLTPAGLVVHPAGTHLYVSNYADGTVSVIDIATKTVIATVRLGPCPNPSSGIVSCAPAGVAVSQDGARLYVAHLIDSGNTGFTGAISVIDTVSNIVAATLPIGPFDPRGIAVTSQGDRIYVANSPLNSVLVINPIGLQVIATIPVGINPVSVAVNPTGTRVYVTNRNFAGVAGNDTVSVIESATNQVVSSIQVGKGPWGIAVSPDGNRVYVANSTQHFVSNTGTVSVISASTNSVVTTIAVGLEPFGLAIHPDGTRVYVTNVLNSNVSVIDTATNAVIATVPVGLDPFAIAISPGTPSPLVAAVLPSSRSVQVGTAATAFATIINAGSTTATECGISVLTNIAANFAYQATDPANQPIANPNTAVNIGAGAAQSFIISLTPTAAIPPTDVRLSFGCSNTNPAPINVGLNTLLFSASATPVPDIVALAATSTNDGIVNILNGTGAFAVAAVNVGVSGSIFVSADTGEAVLPVNIFLCQTDPATGQCISAIGPSVTTEINANATPTFGIFVEGSGAVPFDPAANRIFVQFKDSGGVTRGSTSVAVRTQ